MDQVEQTHMDLTARIRSGAYFSDIAVDRNRKGINKDDILNMLKTFVQKSGKKGVAVIVDRPIRRVTKPNETGPNFDLFFPVSVWIRPLDNDGDNGTKKSMEDVISNLCHLVHGCRLNPRIGQMFCDEDAVTPAVDPNGMIVSEIVFATRLKLVAPVRTATPSIAGDSSQVMLFCNTPGAAIWYTTNGTFPWPGEEAAIRFGVATLVDESNQILITDDGQSLVTVPPFAVEPGTQVRVAAYAPNQQGSDVADAIL